MSGTALAARRLLDSRVALWVVLAAPGVYWLQGYLRETLFYGEVVHATGVLSARLLILTLAITPLARFFPRPRWIGWLRRSRRYFGVAAFGYALMHTVVYLERQAALADIIEDAMAAAMWTGWVALVVMLFLAATSNDLSVRKLGRRWQLLHRAVYVAAILSFAHWVLSAFDPVPGYVHLGVLALIEATRLLRRPARKPARQPAAQSSAPSGSP